MGNVLREKIIKNLREVYDPEISVNVYDLGLIYDISLHELPKAYVTHTLTSAFCPMADEIINDIRKAVLQVNEIDEVEVITTFDPPFDIDKVSSEVKLQLGLTW